MFITLEELSKAFHSLPQTINLFTQAENQVCA